MSKDKKRIQSRQKFFTWEQKISRSLQGLKKRKLAATNFGVLLSPQYPRDEGVDAISLDLLPQVVEESVLMAPP